ncbi:MAG TPA: peptidyl-prolyl cis-trans isomerase [Tepidisphaeraceae bacterium]
MKTFLAGTAVGLALASTFVLRGANAPVPTGPSIAPASASSVTPDAVIAHVNGSPISMGQLQKPLVEGYGLNVLLRLVQLELAKQTAVQNKVTVSPQDLVAERNDTIFKMFQDSNEKLQDKIDKAREKNNQAEVDRLTQEMTQDNERGFQQFLESQHQSEADFNLVIETNVYLRRIAEPMLAGKITEEQLKQAFDAMYGETVECRFIQCATIPEIQQARKRLDAGEDFEAVSRDMSRSEAAKVNGGKLAPFSRDVQGIPDSFKDAAFALEPGQVSEIVQANGAYILIKLEKRNKPKVVKFDDVKDSVRRELYDRATQLTIRQLRQSIQDQAIKVLVVEDPTLKAQLEKRLAQREQVKNSDDVKRQFQKQRDQEKTPDGPALPPPSGIEPLTPVPTPAPAVGDTR